MDQTHAKTLQDAIVQATRLLNEKKCEAVVLIPASMEGSWDDSVGIVRVAELVEPNWYMLSPGRDLNEAALEDALLEIEINKQDGMALMSQDHPSIGDRRKH